MNGLLLSSLDTLINSISYPGLPGTPGLPGVPGMFRLILFIEQDLILKKIFNYLGVPGARGDVGE